MKTLQEFLDNEGTETELKSHREKPDNEYKVKPSSYSSLVTKVTWLIGLLDDIYEIEEREDDIFLKKKLSVKE